MQDWTPEALDALMGLIIDVLLVSFIAFVVQFAGRGVLTVMGFPRAGIGFALLIGFFYLGVILAINASFRALNAAGLLVSIDLIGNLAEFVRTGKVTVRYLERKGPDKPELHVRFPGKGKGFVLKFVTLQYALHWLWIVVNCMLNATWLAILFPWPYYMSLFVLALFAGIHWLISHEQFDFDWFRWFGTVVGITGFSGTMAFMLADYYLQHPYPWLAWVVTFVIGFTWATKHTKAYTALVAIIGLAIFFATWLWSSFRLSLSASIPVDESTLFVLMGLLLMTSAAFLLASRESRGH